MNIAEWQWLANWLEFRADFHRHEISHIPMARFDNFFEWLMKWEGEVFENDPSDSGGATKFGIDSASHPGVNIFALTREKAKIIYHEEYWGAVHADELPAPLDWIMTDIAVNNGRSRAAKWLQIIVGADPDGILGKKTLAAVAAQPAPSIAKALLARREAFYRSIARGSQVKFLKGWLNRNNDLAKVTGMV